MSRENGLFTVPKNKGQLVRQANRIGEMVEFSEWSRAAMIYAWCENVGRGGKKSDTERFTFTEFAALGIWGLKRRQTIAQYWHAWEAARVDGVVTSISGPGEEVSLPDKDEADWNVYYDSGAKPAKKEEPETDTVALDESEGADDEVEAEEKLEPAADKVNEFAAALGDVALVSRKLGKLAERVADMSLNADDSAKLATEIDGLIDALTLLKAGVQSGSWDDQLAEATEE